jgi:Phage related hypothetical protein (DUF1799)
MGLIFEEPEDDDEDGVWPENEGAVMAFFEVCTQFRTVAHGNGMLQRTGLDYLAAEAGFRQAGVAVTPELWQEVRCIEAGVLKADREAEA